MGWGALPALAATAKVERTPSAPTTPARNIILMLADGMGVAQWQATSIVTKQPLRVLEMADCGMITTTPLNTINGDAPSHCTAMATGVNTNGGAVGLGPDGQKLTTITELAAQKGMARGIVSANSLVEGSIVPFVAHAKNRMMLEDITAAYIDQNIDVFIGSGKDYFTHHINGFGPGPGACGGKPGAQAPTRPAMTLTDREDHRDLLKELQQKGYAIAENLDNAAQAKGSKLAALIGAQDIPNLAKGRPEDSFPRSVQIALDKLKDSKNGFFLMVGDMYVDRASHDGNLDLLCKECVNLDKAIRVAVEFAESRKDTLVIVVGSPEASGMSLVSGNVPEGKLEAHWSLPGMIHTGIMVPYFAYGCGADKFQGMLQNTDMFGLLKAAMNL